jgi:ribosome-associated toxin RatA of RatAB toxin-antitoxin module
MPYVESSIDIQGKRENVYELAKDMEKFPQYMPDVSSVKVVERNGNSTVTEWETLVEDIPITWKEIDEFDDTGLNIKYRLIEGDLDKFEGVWKFEDANGATRVTLTVDFDFGMPTLADLIGPVLEMKVRENSMMMLEAIKKKIETG